MVIHTLSESTLSRELFGAIIQLIDQQFGKDYIDSQYLEEILVNNKWQSLVYTENDRLAGISIFKYTTAQELLNENCRAFRQALGKYPPDLKIGYRKITAVPQRLEGQGIGRSLFKTSLKQMEKHVEMICSTAWDRAGSEPAQHLLTEFGFHREALLPHFWQEDTLARNIVCPVCGTPPCSCNAIFYIKHIINQL